MSSGNRQFGRGSEDRKPPPLMDPTRERDRHRILDLFRPYRLRLTAVLVLIVFSAGISMLNPFLLCDVLDEGIAKHNTTLLTWLTIAMIVITTTQTVVARRLATRSQRPPEA